MWRLATVHKLIFRSHLPITALYSHSFFSMFDALVRGRHRKMAQKTRRRTKLELMGMNDKDLLMELIRDIANELDVDTLCHKILLNVSTLTRWGHLTSDTDARHLLPISVQFARRHPTFYMLFKRGHALSCYGRMLRTSWLSALPSICKNIELKTSPFSNSICTVLYITLL